MLYRSLVIVGLLALGACLDSKDYDLNSVTITPTVAFPIASGDLSILDLISDKDSAYIKVYSDGLLYLYYAKTLASQDIRQLFNPADKISNSSVNLPAVTLPPNGSDVKADSIVQAIDLNMSPAQLNEMGIKSGVLNYSISTSPSLPNLTYAINVIMTDVVDKVTQVPMNFTAVGTSTGTRSMQNYKFKMVDNKFNVKLVLIFKQHNNSQFIPPGAKVNVQLSFLSVASSYVKGFFGDRTVPLPNQTLDLTVFSSSLKKSSVTFVQPLVKFLISNDNGVPIEVAFANLDAKKTGATLPIQISPSSPITVNYPTVLGNSSSTTITVGNSSALVNFLPTQMTYSATARINKGLSTGNNFLADTSRLRLTLAAEVPLYGKGTGITLWDTLKVDFGDIKESSVSSSFMKISAVNQLPLDAYLQLYLTDKNYGILDSLFTTNQTYFVKSSTVTASGDLQTAGTSSSQVDISTAKLNKLFSSSYLIIRSKLNTAKDANGSLLNVKFKSTYKLKLSVGLNAKLNLTTAK